MKLRASFLIVTALFLAAESASLGQTIHTVAIRSVSGEPNLYVTAHDLCGPGVSMRGKRWEGEQRVREQQIFQLIDLNSGELEYGDRIRIKKCDNYLRVDSEKVIYSFPAQNRDSTPDDATIFLVRAPAGSSGSQPVELIVLEAHMNGLGGFYVTTGGNTPRTRLTARSDFKGNPQNVLKLVRNPVYPAPAPSQSSSREGRGRNSTRRLPFGQCDKNHPCSEGFCCCMRPNEERGICRSNNWNQSCVVVCRSLP
jgi:hypothetical protein